MTVAERMRKYRARKALRQAVERAQRQGLDAAEIVAEHLETLRLERELADEILAERKARAEREGRNGAQGHAEREGVTPIGVTGEGR